MDHLEAIKRTVEIGYGVTVAPAFAVTREVQLGTLAAIPLADPGAALPLYYVHYAHRRLSRLAEAVVEFVQATTLIASLHLEPVETVHNAFPDRDFEENKMSSAAVS